MISWAEWIERERATEAEFQASMLYRNGKLPPHYPMPAKRYVVVWKEGFVDVVSLVPHGDGEEEWLALTINGDGEALLMSGKG